MGERIRHHATLTLLLQTIIADGVGGVQRFLQVTFFEPVMTLLRMVRPDAGQAIGLQFLTHQQAVVAFHLGATLACGNTVLR